MVAGRLAGLGAFLLLASCQSSPRPPEALEPEVVYFELGLDLPGYGMLDFFVSRPPGFDAEAPVRVLINFPVAGQMRANARALINSPITYQATRRGYVVIVPYAPPRALRGRTLDALPGFLDRLQAEFNVKDRKFDVIGASAGGITALELARRDPDSLRTVIAYPGYLSEPEPDFLQDMRGLCPQIYVGSRDVRFRRRLKRDLQVFEEAGVPVHAEIIPGAGHDFGSFEPERARWLLDRLEAPPPCKEENTFVGDER